MPIELIDNVDDWKRHREKWEQVYAANPNHTPYQSYEWLTAWWQYLGDGELFIVHIQDDEGESLGFAPFFLRKTYLGLPLRNLAFIGVKRTDYLDFIVHKGREDEFFNKLFPWLYEQRKRFSFIELKDVPDTSSNLPFLFSLAGRYFPVFAVESDRICVTIPLPQDWDSFLARLGKRTRRDVGYDRRYLAKRYETELVEYRNGEDVRKGYEDLVRIYNERWQDEKGATRYEESDAAQFERTVVERLAARGDFRLWVLYADERPVAGISGYERNNKIYADVYAHSPEFHKLSVGNVVLGHAFEKCIGYGLNEFDLSRGDEPYKYRWKGQEKRNFHFRIFTSHKAMMWDGLVEQLYHSAINSDTLHKLNSWYRKMRYGAE